MIGTVYSLVGIMISFSILHIHLIKRFKEEREKPSFYLGMAAFFYVLPASLGVLIAFATAIKNISLATIFYQLSTTFGILAYVFLDLFAVSIARPGKEKRYVWIPLIAFFTISFIVWAFNPVAEGTIDGTTEFTLTSTYKPPYGLPLIEIIIVLMSVMGAHPIYLFLHTSKNTKERVIKVKSLLMGLGLLIAALAYTIEVTDAISYVYMPIYRPMIVVGAFFLCFGYLMPKKLERKIAGTINVRPDSVDSIMEKFLAHTSLPKTYGNVQRFSRLLGLGHNHLIGRKILLDVDPASNYENLIQDFAAETLSNQEQFFIFTRRGSTLHSSLKNLKGIKFFYLTQQISVPKELSESEALLPSNDISLILNFFDKMLKATPKGIINVVYDNLSDTVMSIGFEKTYQFVKYAMEILSSSKITTLFLINKAAHDVKIVSSLRSLFSDQISFGKKGLNIVKLTEREFVIDLEGEALEKV